MTTVTVDAHHFDTLLHTAMLFNTVRKGQVTFEQAALLALGGNLTVADVKQAIDPYLDGVIQRTRGMGQTPEAISSPDDLADPTRTVAVPIGDLDLMQGMTDLMARILDDPNRVELAIGLCDGSGYTVEKVAAVREQYRPLVTEFLKARLAQKLRQHSDNAYALPEAV